MFQKTSIQNPTDQTATKQFPVVFIMSLHCHYVVITTLKYILN